MADTATPDAADSPRFSAEKDRSCPFCGTKFTSSSLGRHLDLYIKERNPKPPDGLHDVEEIRRLRGNVTRRQVKLSTSNKREGSTPTSSKPTSSRGQRSPSASASTLPKQRNGGSVSVGINKPNWTSTGVINDIPSAVEDSHDGHGKRRESVRKGSVKEELTRKQVALEERDLARAAELALRDVLGNVKAAHMRANPQSPFDFNLFSLSFPAMCLRCLSTPPALSFGSRISKERSWSVDPPGSYHFDALGRWLETKMRDWKIRRRSLGLGRNVRPEETDGHEDQHTSWSYFDPEANDYENSCMQHLNARYNSWDELSKLQKQEEWHEECVKALTHEQDRHRDTRDRMERLERDVQSLQAELNAQNNNEHRSMSLPLSPPTALETLKLSSESALWDYDALIAKWRTRIQHERSQQHPLPHPSSHWSAQAAEASRSPSYTNGLLAKSGRRAPFDSRLSLGTDGVSEDQELVDAPGEEDDMAVDDVDAGHGFLDPELREEANGEQDLAMANGNPQGEG